MTTPSSAERSRTYHRKHKDDPAYRAKQRAKCKRYYEKRRAAVLAKKHLYNKRVDVKEKRTAYMRDWKRKNQYELKVKYALGFKTIGEARAHIEADAARKLARAA